MEFVSYSLNLPVDGVQLYTVVCLPSAAGKYPILLCRQPYAADLPDEETRRNILADMQGWLEAGYAVVYQHCRGTGCSEGDFVPYINERRDGLRLQQWVREQPFYNGEIFLHGVSYLTSVHYATAPFAPDIKGAVLRVQDSERYNICYRNGFFKAGLHGNWFVEQYKKKSIARKNYTPESFRMLPMEDFSSTVFGERVEVFDQTLLHPLKDDPFWQTHMGGSDARDAVRHARIPVLLVTGFYDIYTGGIFDMWNQMDDVARAQCALAVCPYDHGCSETNQPVAFENGRPEQYADNFAVRWCNAARGLEPFPFPQGKVTYYRLFDQRWGSEDFADGPKSLEIPLGEGEVTYVYNPYNPAHFPGGLSCNFYGTAWQDAPGARYDVKSFFSEPFPENRFVKGKMKARLRVKSDCEDTCFYLRISLDKPEGAYGLRDDIQSISNFCPDYVPGEEVTLEFSFDEHAFLVQAGERIRIDVSSSCDYYIAHTNQKGPFARQRTACVAHNTILCKDSLLTLFTE